VVFARTEAEICRIGRSGLFDLAERSLGASLLGRLRHVRYAGPLTALRGDGARFPVEVSSAVFFDPGGQMVSSMIVRDISGHKRSEEALLAAKVALETANQDLERRVDERTREVRRLAGQLEAAETRERQQIARDLHDELGQTLAAILIRLDMLQSSKDRAVRARARDLVELAQRANESVHSLAIQLAPPVLYELGLVPALHWLADEMQERYRLDVAVDNDERATPLSQETRTVLYRAVRELLINVARHAGTDQARVRIGEPGERVEIDVIDEGVGFDWSSVEGADRQGFGLVGLRERLSYIGGGIVVRSSPGLGASVTLYAPTSSSSARRP
jgi:signal transduction histidine kinase